MNKAQRDEAYDCLSLIGGALTRLPEGVTRTAADAAVMRLAELVQAAHASRQHKAKAPATDDGA